MGHIYLGNVGSLWSLSYECLLLCCSGCNMNKRSHVYNKITLYKTLSHRGLSLHTRLEIWSKSTKFAHATYSKLHFVYSFRYIRYIKRGIHGIKATEPQSLLFIYRHFYLNFIPSFLVLVIALLNLGTRSHKFNINTLLFCKAL